MSAENNCKHVCSRGIMKSCDIYPQQPISSIRQVYPFNWSALESGKTVYINTSAIPYFVAKCLPEMATTTFKVFLNLYKEYFLI